MFKRTHPNASILAIVSLCLSCSPGNFTKAYELNQFKVVAIIADKPEINPGETVTLTPYLSDILGNGRALTYSAQACLDIGVGFGATPNCNDVPGKIELATDVPISGLSTPYFTGSVLPALIVPSPAANDLFAQIPSDQQFNGVDFLVVMQFKTGSETLDTVLKRITVSTNPTKNQNPNFQAPGITSAGSDLTGLNIETKLAGQASPTSFETFDNLKNGNAITQTDSLLVYWFASQGEFNFSSTNPNEETTWKPNDKNNTLPFVLLGVLRDKRGGISVLQKNF